LCASGPHELVIGLKGMEGDGKEEEGGGDYGFEVDER
jgi:hypothetical protein